MAPWPTGRRRSSSLDTPGLDWTKDREPDWDNLLVKGELVELHGAVHIEVDPGGISGWYQRICAKLSGQRQKPDQAVVVQPPGDKHENLEM